jgi:ureidoacrylate peracid hydrolase
MLTARGIDTLIVTGAATNVCVESTVRDAMMLDFRVFMPHNATAALDQDAHLAGVRNVMQSFADVRPVDALLALIDSQSAGARFGLT